MKLTKKVLGIGVLSVVAITVAISSYSSYKEERELEEARLAIEVKDYKKAFYLLQSLAKKDHPEAQVELYIMYRSGREGVVDRDLTKAQEWLKKAADNGSGAAQYTLGRAYAGSTNVGLKEDYDLAIKWFKKAEKQVKKQEPDKVHHVQYRLGRLYEYEKEDGKEAVKWYEKAGEQGSLKAQEQLASIYDENSWRIPLSGVERDNKKAVYWFEKACNHPEARVGSYECKRYRELKGEE